MIAFFNQPDSEDNCCDPCDRSGPCDDCVTIGTFVCTSRTDSGYLRGWSKFQNHNSGDWNLRKFLRLDASGFEIRCNWTTDSSCQSGPAGSGGGLHYPDTYGECDPSDNSFSYSGDIKHSNGAANPSGSACINPGPGSKWVSFAGFIGPNIYDDYDPLGIDTNTYDFLKEYASDGSCFTSGGLYYSNLGTLSFAISVPDTVSAALARESATLGTSCTTSPGTIGSTSAESTTQLSVSNTTAVTATITMNGVSTGTDYDLTITLDKYDTTLMTTVEVEDVVTVTADADDSDDYDYEVPIEDGFEYTITNVEIAPV